MANVLYRKWGEQLLQGTASALLTGTGTTGVYAALVDTGVYTFSQSHEFYSSISSAVVGTPVEIGATKTYTDSVFDGGDVTYTALTGNSAEAIVVYVKNAGANTTWRLVAYFDTGVTNLPVTPNGGDVTCGWNASGILKLIA